MHAGQLRSVYERVGGDSEGQARRVAKSTAMSGRVGWDERVGCVKGGKQRATSGVSREG
jgi:hypothetical protein